MIIFILFLGFLIRLISLNQSLWLDEASSALAARLSLGDLLGKFMPGDFHPPLYYLILNYWTQIFGYSEVSLRIPSIVFGLAAIYLTYRLGKVLVSEKVGWAAAFLLAVSGLHIYYSQEARMYSLAALLVTYAMFSFVKTLRSSRAGDFILFSLSLGAIFLSDYVAIFVLPVFWLGGVVAKKSFSWWKKFITSHIIMVVFAIWWLPVLLKQINIGLSIPQLIPTWWNILGVLSFKNIALIPIKFIFGRVSIDNFSLYIAVSAVVISFFGYLLFKARNAINLLWGWLVVPIFLGAAVSYWVPVLTYFRYLYCLPAFYLLVATGVERLKSFRTLAFIVVFFVTAVSAGVYLFNPRFQRENWRAVAEAVGQDKVIFPSPSHTEALAYYGKSDQIVNTAELTPEDKEVWLSRYVWEISDPTDSTRHKLESLGYNMASVEDFNGVIFWKFIK